MSHWYRVKLELAPSDKFPKGSPGRAYLLRLPLNDAARVDEAELASNPDAAMVRRFWVNEPDQSGTVRRTSTGMALIFPEDRTDYSVHVEDDQIVCGGTLHLANLDGSRTTFRVVSIHPD